MHNVASNCQQKQTPNCSNCEQNPVVRPVPTCPAPNIPETPRIGSIDPIQETQVCQENAEHNNLPYLQIGELAKKQDLDPEDTEGV